MKKNNNSPEQRIRIKIGMIVLVVILYLTGLLLFSIRARDEIKSQKEEIEKARELIKFNDRLILSVQQAQEMQNSYLLSPEKKWQNEYDSLRSVIQQQLSLVDQLTTDDSSKLLLKEMDSLLLEKELIGNRLVTITRSQNPITTLDSKIKIYKDIIRDTVVVTTNLDTVRTLEKSKQNFWGRLKNLFRPKTEVDTTITIAHTQQESWSSPRIDTVAYSDLKQITQQASKTYFTRMSNIEAQVRELVFAEQNISLRISQLITQYYQNAIEKSKRGVDKSDSLTHRIFMFALAVGIISLLIILLIVLMIVDDLNKGQRARSDLVKEKQRSEQIMESRHKLLLAISHDIKTPLSSIMGYMEMWNHGPLSSERKQELRSARNSARHILSMLSNLLEFSRIERKKEVLHIAKFELHRLMDDILSLFDPLIEEKGLTLEYKNHLPYPFVVESDQTLLKQILVNIISNSVKYTHEGKVTVKLSSNNKGTEFTISDTGVGMSDSEIKEIFKPFSRVGDASISEGSGFGLYVTQGLVEALKGTIKITSVKGEGTQVVVQIPIVSIENSKLEKETVVTQEIKRPIENILIFEDDASLGNMLKEYLNRQGYKVKLCGDPRDALGFARVASSYDLVITDLQMKGINGYEILQAIRRVSSQIPVWLMTAHGDYTQERALTEGFTGLLTKPVRLEELIKIVSNNHGNPNEGSDNDDSINGLKALFGNDREAIQEVLLEFVVSAEKDLNELIKLINNHNFREAQQLCHRIHPFYSQLGADKMVLNFRKMDNLRGKSEEEWPEWKEELTTNISEARAFIEKIKRVHL